LEEKKKNRKALKSGFDILKMLDKYIEIKIRQLNFNYQVINKTSPLADKPQWFETLPEAIVFIKEKYKNKKIRIAEENFDNLSFISRGMIRKGLKYLL